MVAVLAGCRAPDYIAPPWDPPRRAVIPSGCVDFVPRLLVDGVGKVPGIPLVISFHSDCKEAVPIDLARVRVRARRADGIWVHLAPYDPRREIHPGLLAPDDVGDEPIEFDPAAGALGAWTLACVDVGAVRTDRPPIAIPPLCLDPRARIVEGGAP